MTDKPMLRISEAADQLRISPGTLRLWVASGKVACFRPSRRVTLIARVEIDRLLASSAVTAGARKF